MRVKKPQARTTLSADRGRDRSPEPSGAPRSGRAPRRATRLALCLAVLGIAPLASARYAAVEIEEIPLERLVANLERAIAAAPEDAGLRQHLARTLAMAWAKRLAETSTVPAVAAEPEPVAPWFGYGETRAVPFASAAPVDRQPEGRPAALLERAIAEYERAVALDPQNVVARLGLAWCRDQAGQEEAGRRDYREILELAWQKDLVAGATLGGYVSSEVIGYLLPLLDPVTDAEEIEGLLAKRQTLASRPRAITPIAIPLGDALSPADLVLPGPGVRFDLDGSGQRLTWQWISPRAAWLVWDPAGRGRIESALQLMGSRSFLLFPADGYEALGLLDDDGDGSLRGRELRGLALWADWNADGRSQPGEVQPLAARGVVGLSCRSRLHPLGIRYAPGGVELEDGRTRDSFDLVMSATNPARAGR